MLERAVADLRRRDGEAERGVEGGLVGRGGQRAERVQVLARARSRGRAPCRAQSGGATTSAIGMPSAVTPVSASSIATISGSAAKRSRAADGSSDATTTASCVGSSTQRRASPATCAAERRGDLAGRGRGPAAAGSRGAPARCACSSAATILASRLRPDPGHLAEAALARRRGAARRQSRSRARRRSRAPAGHPNPSRRPSATSSSGVDRRSSVSSAISPVSTSSRSRASMPRPMPRSSRTRPCRTSEATGTGAARTSSAARRYARALYGFASASSRSAAISSSRPAISALSIAGTSWLTAAL